MLTPNPVTSGGARWNVLAAYGAQLKLGKTPKQAEQYLTTLFQHVVVQDKSARDALNTFLAGKGDALLTYENEALLAQRSGQPVYFNIPKATIRIDNPLAVTTNSKNKADGAGVRQVPLHAGGAEAVRAERLPAGRQGRDQGLQLPGAPAAVHDRLPRRLDEGRRRSSSTRTPG